MTGARAVHVDVGDALGLGRRLQHDVQLGLLCSQIRHVGRGEGHAQAGGAAGHRQQRRVAVQHDPGLRRPRLHGSEHLIDLGSGGRHLGRQRIGSALDVITLTGLKGDGPLGTLHSDIGEPQIIAADRDHDDTGR